MFARVGIYDVPTESISRAAATFGEAIAQIRGLSGFAGAQVLVNAESGRALTLTVWNSRMEMEASRVTASRLRSEAAGLLNGSVVSSDEYEIAVSEML